MLQRSTLFVALLALLSSVTAFAADPAPRAFAPVQDGFAPSAPEVLPWAPDRVLIKFTPEALQKSGLAANKGRPDVTAKATDLQSLDALLGQVGAVGIRALHKPVANKAAAAELGVEQWFMVDLAGGMDIPEVTARLAQDPNLEEALPDLRAFPAVVPNDTDYADNWGHDNTAQLPAFGWGTTWDHTGAGVGTVGFDANADLAWNAGQGFGSSSVVIAIMDSGVDTTHPDLLNLVAGWDFGDGDSNPDDNSGQPGHGTACAGVAAASTNNNLGVAGVAGGCSIMPLKVADSSGSMFFSYIVNAVYHAADNGADIVSMSFGAATTAYSPMDAALTYGNNAGVTFLAATGNENASQISYPAYNPVVIGVGAASPCGERKRSSSSSSEVNSGVNTDPNGYTCDGERWWGSNYGSTTQDHQGAVDIIAPTILPTTDISGSGGYRSGDYEPFFNGTSCATPYAAGVCALIKSANPGFTPAQVRAQLVSTAMDIVSVESVSGWDRYTGYGMVDAAAAVGGGVSEPPVAAFTQDATSGCVPFVVNFTDQSTGDVSSYAWTFGDGGTSTQANPSHSYAATGVYTVSLTVTGPGGDDTVTMTNLISVDGPPIAAYSAVPASITAGESVTFTDFSLNAEGWFWQFGDGQTSTLQNPVHVYSAAGQYTVSLTAANGCGNDVATFVNQITVAEATISAEVFPANGLNGAVSVYSLPDGTGSPLTSALSWSGNAGDDPVVVDATIKVRLTDSAGLPVVGFPAASITIQAQSGGWSECAGHELTADAPTDGNGETTISGALFAGGYSATGELLQVIVDSPVLTGTTYPGGLAGLQYYVNSADINGDLEANLGDVPAFVNAFFSATYTYAADYQWNGAVNLSDVTILSGGLGTVCTPAKAGAVAEAELPANVGEMGIVFDQNGAEVARMAEPGERVDAWVVLRGQAAAEGVSAFEARVRTSANVTIHASEVVGEGLNVGGDADPIVGYSDARRSGAAALQLLRLTLSVSDSEPAYLYLEPGRTSGLPVPAVVQEGDVFTARPASGDVREPVASLNDKDFTLGDQAPVARNLAMSIAPNPFNPMTEIRFSLPQAGLVDLKVFDARGKLVTTLTSEVMGAGEHVVVWNGTDRGGRSVASGVYFSSLRTGEGTVMQKMLLMK